MKTKNEYLKNLTRLASSATDEDRHIYEQLTANPVYSHAACNIEMLLKDMYRGMEPDGYDDKKLADEAYTKLDRILWTIPGGAATAAVQGIADGIRKVISAEIENTLYTETAAAETAKTEGAETVKTEAAETEAAETEATETAATETEATETAATETAKTEAAETEAAETEAAETEGAETEAAETAATDTTAATDKAETPSTGIAQ
jgi:hypothetical protein